VGILITNTLVSLIISSIGFISIATSAEAVIVVANTSGKAIELNRQQVRNLFMGDTIEYDLQAIALPPENHTRVLFNTKIVGLTESRIQSYWAQMRFTGRKKEPKEMSNEKLSLEYVKNHKGSVTYLSIDTPIPQGLTIIYQAL
jgi:hypothetical protein